MLNVFTQDIWLLAEITSFRHQGIILNFAQCDDSIVVSWKSISYLSGINSCI